MPSAPQTVLDLVERFAHNLDAYHRPDYNETQVRREFIDPLFTALGWDVDNRQGVSPRYQEVIHEVSLREKDSVRAPDYGFRVGSETRFYVEAKKPVVDVYYDVHPAYQLRRYAWTAKLPLSILTDFEEFSVYDCRIPPKPSDKAATARILYLNYQEYTERWEEIATIFSHEAVLRGDYDRFAESKRDKRGTQKVDAVFLQEMEDWRALLASNIALRNPELTTHDLNYAVQAILDRIIFLRICEDRDVEPYEQLRNILPGDGVYGRLLDQFRRADERYNSGLFHFREERGRAETPDTLTPALRLDDKVLREIIGQLYYPHSPYAFRVLGVDVLGSVYERFLGSVIRLTPAHRAVVEQKPEVRKSGGVYYTPKYIVDYIVKQTVGQLIEGRTPGEIAKLRILDAACGSGSFLLGAYDYLLRYHLNWYVEHPTKQARREVYQGRGGEWFLTTEEKKRILLNNLYGVDIDSQAVEVTKLSLLLKVLEGENRETLATQLAMFRERALPDLASNIKCGNSLIGPDFYEGKQLGLLDEEETYRVNAFDWKKEFGEIIREGGFDAVIGNPPYLKEANNKATFDALRSSEVAKYCVGKMDLWYAFACRALDLTRSGGLHSFIATNNWVTNSGASVLREKIMEEARLKSFLDFADFRVFGSASIQTMIYVCVHERASGSYTIDYLKWTNPRSDEQEVRAALEARGDMDMGWEQATIDPAPGSAPFTLLSNQVASVVNRMSAGTRSRLNSDEIGNGIDVLQDAVSQHHLAKLPKGRAELGQGIFVLSDDEIAHSGFTAADIRKIVPYYTTEQLGRYTAERETHKHLIYADKEVRESIGDFPGIKQHLDSFAPVLTSAFAPYGLHRPRGERYFTGGERLLSVRKTRRPAFACVDFPCYVSRAFLVIAPSGRREQAKYLAGILNSRLGFFWLYHAGKKQGDQLQVDKEPLLAFPIRTIDFSAPADVARHERMVALVEQMLALHKRLAGARTPTQKELLQRRIEATDRQIDRLVYELYGLTEEEIKIVEESGV